MKKVIKLAGFLICWLPQYALYAQGTTGSEVSQSASAALLLEKEWSATNADSLFLFSLVEQGLDTLDRVSSTHKGKIYKHVGQILLSYSMIDSALYYFEKAEPLYADTDQEKAFLYMDISDAWTQKVMYSPSSAALFQALDILEKQGDEAATALCLAKIGDLLDRMEDL